MAKRVYTALVELEAPNENDFVDTPFDTHQEFAAWLSRHLNGEGDAGRFACNLHGMAPAPGSNTVTVRSGDRLKALTTITLGHVIQVTK